MKKIVEGIIKAIPGVLAVCIAEIESGMTLASKTTTSDIEPELAAAYNAEVIKQKLKAKKALGLEGQAIEDILISLTDQYHVLMIIPGGKHFLYAAATKEANLAIMRSILRKQIDEIGSKI